MLPEDELLGMITSSDPQVRVMALNRIYAARKASPVLLASVEKAIQDVDPLVAQKARWVLRSLAEPGLNDVRQVDQPFESKQPPTGAEKAASEVAADRQRFYGAHAKQPYPPIVGSNSTKQAKKNNIGDSYGCVRVITVIFLITFGVVLFLIGSAGAWGIYQDQQTIKASLSWPVSNGNVTSTRIEKIHHKESTGYEPIVTYTYAVNGKVHTCSLNLSEARSNQEAAEMLSKFPLGFKILVSYNPQQPEMCITQYDQARSVWIGIVFALFGLGIAGSGIKQVLFSRIR